jgi:hypothetical protein
MTGSTYLVAWRHNMDDVPIRLCDTLDEAMTVAKECPFSTGYKIAGRLGIDCSTPVCFAVYEFENGRPVQIHFAKREDDA